MLNYTTHTATVFGVKLTYLSDPEKFPVRRVSGDRMTDQGLLDGRGWRFVRVTPDGKAWSADALEVEPQGYEIVAEKWVDGEYLGRGFAVDTGEFERVGIKPTICGSLSE